MFSVCSPGTCTRDKCVVNSLGKPTKLPLLAHNDIKSNSAILKSKFILSDTLLWVAVENVDQHKKKNQ